MRVLAPFIRGSQPREAYRALVEYVPIGSLEMVETGYDTSAYWWELRRRWNGEDDLMIVEQDNVITAEVIPSFNACDKPWCVYEYLGPPGMDVDGTGEGRILRKSLGCTRFSAELQDKVTAAMISDKDYFVWHLLDMRIARLLEMHGYESHVHGAIKHCHRYTTDPEKIFKDRAMRLAGMQQERSMNGTLQKDQDKAGQGSEGAQGEKAEEGAASCSPREVG